MALQRFLIFLGGAVGSYGGWWLAERLGGDLLVATVVSGVAAVAGILFAWRLHRDHLS